MAHRDEAGGRAAGKFMGRIAVVAIVVVALIAVWIFFFADQDPPGSEMPEDVGARPTGAGSLPDDAVDERIEGLENQTTTDDFIDQSGASDTRPAILDPGNGPDPAASVEELDVPERINEGVVEPGQPTVPEEDAGAAQDADGGETENP